MYTGGDRRQVKEDTTGSHTPRRLRRLWGRCIGDEADERFNQPSVLDQKKGELPKSIMKHWSVTHVICDISLENPFRGIDQSILLRLRQS